MLCNVLSQWVLGIGGAEERLDAVSIYKDMA